MWALALLWFVATPALLLVRLGEWLGGARGAVAAIATGVLAVSLCPGRTLELWHDTRSDAVARLVHEPWFVHTFQDPEAVGITSVGTTWMMLYYARTPIVPRVTSVAELEDLKRRVLSRLGPGRKVWFVMDGLMVEYEPELYAFLKAHGPSEQHLELWKEDPHLGFELFDLTDWARP